MEDPLYCPWIFGAPCLKPEVWAAAWQAVLSAAAIVISAWVVKDQDRQTQLRRTGVYVNLIKEALVQTNRVRQFFAFRADRVEGLMPYEDELKALEQLGKALRSVSLENLPDYRLLSPITSCATTCEKLLDEIKVVNPATMNNGAVIYLAKVEEAQDRVSTCFSNAYSAYSTYYGSGAASLIGKARLKFSLWRIGAKH